MASRLGVMLAVVVLKEASNRFQRHNTFRKGGLEVHSTRLPNVGSKKSLLAGIGLVHDATPHQFDFTSIHEVKDRARTL